ncbi:MAG: phenylacetate-CoA oxygenase/reductase subunit PaaK [Candidatus Kapaibacteriales bacterium]
MSTQFYDIKVKRINRETDKAVSVFFDVPDNLKSEFNYSAGQYLTLRETIGGEDIRRAYSCSTSPANGDDIAVTVKEVDGGRFSTFLNRDLKEGQVLKVMPPNGNFTLDRLSNPSNDVVLIGGGSGITPLISIAETVLQNSPEKKVTLIYANTAPDQIIFRERLDALESSNTNFNVVHLITDTEVGDWKGRIGSFDSGICLDMLQSAISTGANENDYFLCGPQGLMDQAELALTRFGADKIRIHKELFTASVPAADSFKIVSAESGQDVVDRDITVRVYGDEHRIKVESSETVLMAAIQQSLDPPYSCQIGACSTCRARLVSGQVMMEDHDALTEDEIEEGYVLTCTAHPLTDDVVIDYDD